MVSPAEGRLVKDVESRPGQDKLAAWKVPPVRSKNQKAAPVFPAVRLPLKVAEPEETATVPPTSVSVVPVVKAPPLTKNVPPLAVTAPPVVVPAGIANVPAFTVVDPLYVFAPVRFSVPTPFFVKETVPRVFWIAPEKVPPLPLLPMLSAIVPAAELSIVPLPLKPSMVRPNP